MKATRVYIGMILGCLLSLQAYGQAASPVENQLREALRNTTLQLRTVQNELAVTQSENEVLLAEKRQLQQRVEALQKQSAADQSMARSNIANLNSQLESKNAEAARLAESLLKWQQGYQRAADLVREQDQDKKLAAARISELQRELDALYSRNRELYRIGSEILDRYEDFGLGRAIRAREPFTGLARASLKALVQDYRDALSDYRIHSETTAALEPIEP